jgi:hypothetical protein
VLGLTDFATDNVGKSGKPDHIRSRCKGPANVQSYHDLEEYKQFLAFRNQAIEQDKHVSWESVEQAWLDAFVDCNVPFQSASRPSFQTAFDLSQV